MTWHDVTWRGECIRNGDIPHPPPESWFCRWWGKWRGVREGQEGGGVRRGDVRGGKWEVRGERWEVRGERWEVRGERWEVRGERWEVRGERWEVRGARVGWLTQLYSRNQEELETMVISCNKTNEKKQEREHHVCPPPPSSPSPLQSVIVWQCPSRERLPLSPRCSSPLPSPFLLFSSLTFYNRFMCTKSPFSPHVM